LHRASGAGRIYQDPHEAHDDELHAARTWLRTSLARSVRRADLLAVDGTSATGDALGAPSLVARDVRDVDAIAALGKRRWVTALTFA